MRQGSIPRSSPTETGWTGQWLDVTARATIQGSSGLGFNADAALRLHLSGSKRNFLRSCYFCHLAAVILETPKLETRRLVFRTCISRYLSALLYYPSLILLKWHTQLFQFDAIYSLWHIQHVHDVCQLLRLYWAADCVGQCG